MLSTRRQSSRFLPFLVISVLFHLTLFPLAQLIPLKGTLPAQRAGHRVSPPKLTLFSTPPDSLPQKFFVPTESWQPQRLTPKKETPLESDRSTRLQSEAPGKDPQSALPEMRGHPKAGIQYVDIPPTRTHPGQSSRSPSSQGSPMDRNLPQNGKSQAQATANPREAPSTRPPRKETFENAEFPVVRADSPSQAPSPGVGPERRAPERQSSNSSSQETFRWQQPATGSPGSVRTQERYRREIHGGRTAEIGPSSPEAAETELGRYKAKMYRAIGSAWYWLVDQNMTLLALGTVRIKFYVTADGTVRDLSVMTESGETAVLRAISLQSIRKAFPMEPFSESLKRQVGDGFWEECSFTIY
ncbi:putative Outer membrane biosynthesis protein TonB [Candidatus Methylacidithermus pantelleriae]|uniref:Putative Outer membrane biosynthesis protein TonB n=2 Tax=Candidatus Methylacidithermus pantelleriae TaxID=2744239 RepID=A0A8J2BN97_9BACT|nr:putative Outer membrane biosynthesis protein TonB [Candidatus Methylacidithermus pantelleriae]